MSDGGMGGYMPLDGDALPVTPKASAGYPAPPQSPAKYIPEKSIKNWRLLQDICARLDSLDSLKLRQAIYSLITSDEDLDRVNELVLKMQADNENNAVMQRDWNNEFQTVLSFIKDETILDAEEHFRNLAALGNDFLYAANAYGKVIISEKFLPIADKTIKPIEVGGIAGGEKYLVHGILFKFAIDHKGLYGSDEYAAKAAGLEMTGLKHFYNALVPGLHVPMMVLIDYRGFRLIASSCAPVSQLTLVYGSADAGTTVKANNGTANRLMQEVAMRLNLKEHWAGLKSEGAQLLHMPCDIEGHLGKDNRFYALDFGRLAPRIPCRKSPMWKALRPELVRQYAAPLSSDAYSGFSDKQPDYLENNRDVANAYLSLFEVHLPQFVQTLETMDPAIGTSEWLQEHMHKRGINMRYLGVVYALVNNTGWKRVLLDEMVARTVTLLLHAQLRATMKKVKLPAETPYHKCAVEFLNQILGNSFKALEFWRRSLNDEVTTRFGVVNVSVKLYRGPDDATKEGAPAPAVMPHPASAHVTYRLEDGTTVAGPSTTHPIEYADITEILSPLVVDLRAAFPDFCGLFARICVHAAITINKRAFDHFAANPSAFDRAYPIDITNLLSLNEKVTRMTIIEYAEGTANFIKARAAKKANSPDEAARLGALAREQFDRVLIDTEHAPTLTNYGFLTEELEADAVKALAWYQRAIDADPRALRSIYYSAMVFERTIKDMERAESFYLRAIEVNPRHVNSLKDYAMFLFKQRQQPEQAYEYYVRALSSDSMHNVAWTRCIKFLQDAGLIARFTALCVQILDATSDRGLADPARKQLEDMCMAAERNDRFDDAENLFGLWCRADSTSGRPHWAFGQYWHKKRKDVMKAYTHYETAMSKDTSENGYRTYLAFLMTDAQFVNVARQTASNALTAYPNSLRLKDYAVALGLRAKP